MMTIFLLIFSGILGSGFIIFLIQKSRISNFYKNLYKLRLNTLNNDRYKLKICHQALRSPRKEVYEIIKGFQIFIKLYQELSQKDKAPEQGNENLTTVNENLTTVNENLTQELYKIIDQNYALRETLTKLEKEYKRIGTLLMKKFKSRLYNDKLELINKKIKNINLDFNYAINLASISMIDSHQAKNKLFSSTDDVRRSLIYTLDPA